MHAIEGPAISSAPAVADISRIVSEFREGKLNALARAISIVERRDPTAPRLLDGLCSEVPRCRVIGLTGPPGAGKSTLTDALVHQLRERDGSVAVLAVDPNSPHSGGALLGDRIRLRGHLTDPRVFIRSMGARGHMGGLASATNDVIRLLSAFGFDSVLLETVGVGQSETEIAGVADTTVVVLTPGQGDSVQMLKAGIIEIADVFVINKADHAGARTTVRQVRHSLNIGPHAPWRPPIVMTIATSSSGIEELMAAIDRHQAHLAATGELACRRQRQLQAEVTELVTTWARAETGRVLSEDPQLMETLLKLGVPQAAANVVIDRIRAADGVH